MLDTFGSLCGGKWNQKNKQSEATNKGTLPSINSAVQAF